MPPKNLFHPGFMGRRGEGGRGTPLYPNLEASTYHHGSAFPARRGHGEATWLIPFHLLNSKCMFPFQPPVPSSCVPSSDTGQALLQADSEPFKIPLRAGGLPWPAGSGSGGHRARWVPQQELGEVGEDLRDGLDHSSCIKLHGHQCLWALQRWEQGELLRTDTQTPCTSLGRTVQTHLHSPCLPIGQQGHPSIAHTTLQLLPTAPSHP